MATAEQPKQKGLHLVIVDPNDQLMFEYHTYGSAKGRPFPAGWGQPQPAATAEPYAVILNHHFLLFASLDLVDALSHDTTSLFLKVIERLRDVSISVYVTPSGLRFLLLHPAQGLHDETIKAFLSGVHESYIKVLLDPFYDQTKPLVSTQFHQRVAQLVQKYLSSIVQPPGS